MCRASGVPKPKVMWQRLTDDDTLEEIDNESHMVCSDSEDYDVSFEQQSQNAILGKTCNATSGIAPTITVTTVSRLELPGNPVQLMCRASGVPKPKVMWQRLTDDDTLEEIDNESHMVCSDSEDYDVSFLGNNVKMQF
ncbi:unnamed protein product [Strongylus vulgaris]|uniref:Ig-like domain-containing protein n=1 Tax=Strongylus vulgaris TaxID=40348 RepID=A0A3P7LQF2_STRVU|nr:unnamed protein product [Strongylus vulgaris]